MPDQDTRIAVVENELGHMKEVIDENKQEHKEIRQQLTILDTKIDKIEQHLARQNGAIPHLQEGMKELLNRVKGTEKKADEIAKEANATSLKTKVIWGGIGSILLAGLTVLLKFLVGV